MSGNVAPTTNVALCSFIQQSHCSGSGVSLGGWLSGNGVAHINEVTLIRQVRLVLGWVTVRGYTIQVFNQVIQAHSAWPSLRG